jgi:hypothetical protein
LAAFQFLQLDAYRGAISADHLRQKVMSDRMEQLKARLAVKSARRSRMLWQEHVLKLEPDSN